MSQHLHYGQSTPTPRPSYHIQPQQSPVQNQFFPASLPSNNRQQATPPDQCQQQPQPQQHQYQQPPQPQHQNQQQYQEHQLHQQLLPQHQLHQQQPLPQHFQTHQAYHQFQNPSQTFYGNTQLTDIGLIPTPALHVPPQLYAPSFNDQSGNTSNIQAPPVKLVEASCSGSPQQQLNPMAAPAALPIPPGSNRPHPQRSPTQDGGIVQQAPLQNPSQSQGLKAAQSGAPQAQSPQSVAREKARVSVLLEINSYLLQEVVSLQTQGKAGGSAGSLPQQSPTHETVAGSPSSTTDPSNPLNNSPIDPSKPAGAKPPSQEYIECMRRLQANLAYLAALADAKKKAAGSIPAAPAIMAPPSHLAEVRELYKKLNILFPNVSQSVGNRTTQMPGTQLQNSG